MTWALDGYLIRRVIGRRGGCSNPFFYRHLDRMALLDGYLIGWTGRLLGVPLMIAKEIAQ